MLTTRLRLVDEENQEIEDLGLDGDEFASAAQLAPRGVKNIVVEEQQCRSPWDHAS